MHAVAHSGRTSLCTCAVLTLPRCAGRGGRTAAGRTTPFTCNVATRCVASAACIVRLLLILSVCPPVCLLYVNVEALSVSEHDLAPLAVHLLYRMLQLLPATVRAWVSRFNALAVEKYVCLTVNQSDCLSCLCCLFLLRGVDAWLVVMAGLWRDIFRRC